MAARTMGLNVLNVLTGAILAMWLAVVAVAVWRARRPVPESELKRWATTYSLTLTAANWPVVAAYLQRVRRTRQVGFALGYAVLGPVAALLDSDGPFFVYLFLPYSVSVVLVEVRRQRPSATGAADLAPRTISRYLPVRLVWLPRALLVVVVTLGIGTLWVDDPTTPSWTVSRPAVVGYLAAGVVFQGLGELVERAIVRRRQPVGPPDLLAADDAMRAHATHAVGGALVSIHSCLLLVATVRAAQANVLGPTFDTVMILGPVIGMAVGMWFQDRAWRVPRTPPPPPASPPSPVGARS